MFLPDFEDRLFSRRAVPTVTVQKHNPLEAVRQEILSEIVEQVEVPAGCRRQGAGEVEMMLGVPQRSTARARAKARSAATVMQAFNRLIRSRRVSASAHTSAAVLRRLTTSRRMSRADVTSRLPVVP